MIALGLGRTKKGSSKFIIQDVKSFQSEIEKLDGVIEIQIREVKEDGTSKQIWYIENKIIPLLQELSTEVGEFMNEDDARNHIVHHVCKFERDVNLEGMTKDELSIIIDRSKYFIHEFFAEQLNGRRLW